jgi:hypothetical protein
MAFISSKKLKSIETHSFTRALKINGFYSVNLLVLFDKQVIIPININDRGTDLSDMKSYIIKSY